MNEKEILREILQMIQDLTCMISDNKDEFISTKLKETHDRAKLLAQYLL